MEKTITIYRCDICGTELKLDDMCVSEYDVIKLKTLTIDIWYNGIFSTRHTCSKCSTSIINHIKSISLGGKLHTEGWLKK
jgi:hypothetical protein